MKQGFLKKCLIPGLGREKCKMSLVHLMLSTDKEGSAQKKKKKKEWDYMSKEHWNHSRTDPMA
jgi:hypothetical protein